MKKKFKGKSTMEFTLAELSGRMTITLDTAGLMIEKPVMGSKEGKPLCASFGMFGGGNSGYHYTEIKAASDVVPKPEDFVEVPFRLLTATTVGAYSYKATDFSDAKMLEASMPMLQGKPVYKNHDTDVNNWIGVIKEVKWTPAFTTAKGIKVPAGIDGVLSIDSKTDPTTVRGLLMGAIYSNSVTVEFDWEASHEFNNAQEFSMNVGKVVKGTMVRRMATSIANYHETSLVFLGADPFAKLLDKQGNLMNIDVSSISYSKEDVEGLEKTCKAKIEFGLDKEIISLSSDNFHKTEKTITEMDKLMLEALRKLLGLAADAEVTPAMVSGIQLADPTKLRKAELLDSLTEGVEVFCLSKPTEKTKVTLEGDKDKTAFKGFDPSKYIMLSKEDFEAATKASTEVTELTKKKGELETKITQLEPLAKAGEEFGKLQRAEGIRLYKLAAGDKADAAVIKLFEEAAPDAVVALTNSYVKGATMKFGGKCKKCGDTEFEFRSSITNTKDEDAPAPADTKTTSFEEIHKKYDKSPMNIAK